MSKDPQDRAPFHRVLATAPADTATFLDVHGIPFTAGQIRGAAAAAQRHIDDTSGPLFVYTQSAAMWCAALLVAAARGRALVSLPQAGQDYRHDLGIKGADFLTDAATDDGVRLAIDQRDAEILVQTDDPVLSFFTSGSTGKPKRIDKPLSAIQCEAHYWAGEWSGTANHITATVSHQHVYGLIFRIALPLVSKMTSADQAALSWEAALPPSIDSGTLLITSPAHLSRLPDAESFEAPSPSIITSSGGPLAMDDAVACKALFGVAPIEILGSTETGGVARRQRDNGEAPWAFLDGVRGTVLESGILEVHSPHTGQAGGVELGDSVEMLPDGRFHLGARLDRITKIDGKRVSLQTVEDGLAGHRLVTDVAVVALDDGPSTRLGALVVLSKDGRLALGEEGAFNLARQIKTDLADRLAPAERPKRWRFVPALPLNTQGKRVPKTLIALFDAWRFRDGLRPHNIEIDGAKATISFELPADLPWLEGHFVGNPVLPGLAQVHMAVSAAEDIWSFRPGSFDVARMKFRRVMVPGDKADLELSCDFERGRLSFNYSFGDIAYSSGVIG